MSGGDRDIIISNWDDFQHYKNRDVPWIKSYTRLMAKDEYLELSFHLRGILHSLWLEYAASNRQLRDSTVALTRRLGQRVTMRDLETLNHAGFITFQSRQPSRHGLDLTRSREGETEREEQEQVQEQDQKPATATAVVDAASTNGHDPELVRTEIQESLASVVQAGTTSNDLQQPEPDTWEVPL